jgi:putative flippase GtrA
LKAFSLFATGLIQLERATILRLVRFVGVGGLSTGVYWILVLLLAGAFGVNATLASALAYLAGVVTAYAGHRNFTYRSAAAMSPEIVRFFATQAVCFVIGNLVFWLAVSRFHANYVVGGLLLTAVSLSLGLAAYELWVFQDGRRAKPQR